MCLKDIDKKKKTNSFYQRTVVLILQANFARCKCLKSWTMSPSSVHHVLYDVALSHWIGVN